MRRTSLEIDEDRLTRVQRVLGTTGIKDTIEKAFDQVLRADLLRRLARRVTSGEGVDRTTEVLDESRESNR